MAASVTNKSELARTLGISRQSLYYKPKRDQIDLEVKNQIESVLVFHPEYGHKRVALQLKFNKKRVLRVMKKYNIKPYRRQVRKPVKVSPPQEQECPNIVLKLCPIRPGVVWVTDFTYIKYQAKFIYLATIIDRYTREVVGMSVSRFHNRFLVMEAFLDAIRTHPPPIWLHSDRGSEYGSDEFRDLVISHNTTISLSAKGSPWQNGHQESFYGRFKVEAGDLSRFETLGELVEYIYQRIYYYNNERIHSALKMSPVAFRLQFERRINPQPV